MATKGKKVKPVGVTPTALTGAEFQQKVCELWKHTKGKPRDPIVYPIPQPQLNSDHELPLTTEIELAESFAYITAVRKGAESVSAAAIGLPKNKHDGLILYVASNDGVPSDTQQHLRSIIMAMQRIASGHVKRDVCKDLILTEILEMNSGRINARLRARRYNRPIVLQGLQQILNNVTNAGSNINNLATLKDRLCHLCQCLEAYTITAKSSTSIKDLKTLVLACRSFWARPGNESTRDMLIRAGCDLNVMHGNPHLLQIAKIAAYDYISQMMVKHASDRIFKELYRHITIQYVPAYSSIPTVVPPSIAGGGKECRVHAEVQLVIALDTNQTTKWKRPRTIGSSKAACFLCDVFMQKHGVYFVPHSHGLLTPFWAIPNSGRLTAAQKRKYQSIIQDMNKELLRLKSLRHPHRLDPAMSWQALSHLGASYDSWRSLRVSTPTVSEHSIGVASVLSHAMEKPSPSAGIATISTNGRLDNHLAGYAVFPSLVEPLAAALKNTSGEHSQTSTCRSSSEQIEEAVIGKRYDKAAKRQLDSADKQILLHEHSNGTYRNSSIFSLKSNKAVDNVLITTDEPNPNTVVNNISNSPNLTSSNISSGRHVSAEADAVHGLVSQGLDNHVVIKDHESQIRNNLCRDTVMQPSTSDCRSLVARPDLSQRVDFHDMELFVEVESPATVLVSVRHHSPDQSLASTRTVDIGALKPGEELVIDTSDGAGSPERLCLVLHRQFGVTKQWMMDWTLERVDEKC